MMGMDNSSFYLSWIIYYEGVYLINSLLISAVLKGVFPSVDYSLMLIYHFLFCNVLIFQSIFIT